MDFRLLGPVEVMCAGTRLPLRGKQRALIALLALSPNELVSRDRLIDELWGSAPPASAANALQVYVSQIRKLLESDATPSDAKVLLTRPGGYALHVEPDEVDVDRFRARLREGQEALGEKDYDLALEKLDEALSLWRGEPLSDVTFESFARAEVVRLEELRLAAFEARAEARLALGKHRDAATELETLVVQNPLRERFREQLMIALYRSGRQAEALDAYQDARRTLVDELGLEPGPSLQRLEHAILQQEAWLEPPLPEAGRGTEQAEKQPREVRKTVSVLHARLEVAAEDGRAVDVEESRYVFRAAVSAADPVVQRHGGVVDRRRGEAIAVLFGAPAVHEDDPLRAVHAARELLTATETLAAGLRQTHGLRVSMHVGVSTGTALLAESGGGGSVLAGDVTISARQLSEAAAAGEVLVSSETQRALSAAVQTEPAGERAWRLLEILAPPGQLPRSFHAPLVGRQEELAALRTAVERVAADRRCRLFTILGPAGMGKSRLAREFRAATAKEALFLNGRCLSYGEGITFWPLIEIVRQAIGDDIAARLSEFTVGDPEADRLQAAVLAATGRAERQITREEMFWGVRRLLERLARERTLVVAIDDLHWAEPTLLDLVEHIVDWVRDARILVLCLARPELLDRRPTWGGGKMNATTHLLAPLTPQESRGLVAQLVEGGRAEFEDRVVDAAEGNPLFIEQLLAMGDESGSRDVSLPPSVEALIAARLDLLSSEERAVVDAGAVIGRDFWSTAVVQLVQQPPERVTALLSGLIRNQLVRPADSKLAGQQAFRFEHQLIRDVAYASQVQETRTAFHERFADWLEASGETELEEILGYHLEQAHRYRHALDPDDAAVIALGQRAAERLGNAGRRAYGRGDLPAAANLLSRAAALELPEADRPAVLVDLGDALRDLGDFERSQAVLDEAVEQASALGQRAIVARATAVRLRLRLYRVSSVDLEQLLDEAKETVTELENLGDERALAEAWTVLAWIPWVRCRAEEAEQAVVRALGHARRARDERAENFALTHYLGTAVFGPRPVGEGLERCYEALAWDRLAPRVEAMAYRACAALKGMVGEFDEARELLERDRALVENLGLPVPLAMATEVWGLVELLADQPVAAEAKLREGLAILTPIGEMSGRFELEALLAEALYAQERYDDAFALTTETMDAAPREDVSAQVRWRGPRAKCLARRRSGKEAERLAREAVEFAETTDFLNLRANALSDLAEIFRIGKRPTEARAALKKALTLFTKKGNTVASARTRTQLRALSAVKPRAARSARARSA